MTYPPLTLNLQHISVTRNYRKVFKPVSCSLTNQSGLYLEGNNGAGKTTLLKVLAGINTQYSGTLQLNALERREWAHSYAAHLIYIGHNLGLKEDLTARENIESLLALRGYSRSRAEIMETFEILSIPTQQRALRFLSAGQRRRVALSRLWLESAPIWILDEPFTALDHDSIILLERKIIAHRNNHGMVLLTSHLKPSNKVYTINFQLDPY